MRRRLSLALLAVLVVLMVFASTRYLSDGNQAARSPAREAPDTLTRPDSGTRVDVPQDVDTMCIASRFGLPCNPN
jgi:hypothetical protein